jgi:hypothetical protein
MISIWGAEAFLKIDRHMRDIYLSLHANQAADLNRMSIVPVLDNGCARYNDAIGPHGHSAIREAIGSVGDHATNHKVPRGVTRGMYPRSTHCGG